MMNCEQATRLMSDGCERDLTIRERAAIKMHNLVCIGCRNFNVQMHDLGRIARRYAKERGEVPTDNSSASKGFNSKE